VKISQSQEFWIPRGVFGTLPVTSQCIQQNSIQWDLLDLEPELLGPSNLIACQYVYNISTVNRKHSLQRVKLKMEH
jgi:hypothetical protein